MYQTSIRNKKNKKIISNIKTNSYELDPEIEEYAYVIKMLGNCRVSLITNTGNECIGVIRGNLKRFSNRVLIEKGDLIAVSTRDFQKNKVDIVHKFNRDQVLILISEEKISNILINYYNNNYKLANNFIENDNIEFKEEVDDVDYNNINITDSSNSSEGEIEIDDI
jgi:initiation factor 1A|uniref:S1-like domain-containing protein n=1 Tax=viral metagenome TaxID=1070528 RepID=A0A6C0JP00_9ZZZZ